MNKTISKALLATLAVSAIVPSAFALDLDTLDTTNTGSSTATASGATSTWTASTSTGTSNTTTTGKTVSKIQIVTDSPTLPADGKKSVKIVIQVSDTDNKFLSDEDVEMKAEIVGNDSANSLGVFNTGAFLKDSNYFEFSYVAGTKAGEIQLKVTATSKTNKTNVIEQVEKLVLVEAKDAAVSTTPVTTTVATTSTGTMTEPTTSTGTEVASTGATETGSVSAINIVKTEVLDLNRIKVTFDNEIALSDTPLEMITIESVKDKTKIDLSNVSLSSDKKSLIVFSKDSLKKEEYHVIVNSVVDWKTMKAVSVANGQTTVSWMGEIAMLAMAFIAAIGAFLFRRKQSI